MKKTINKSLTIYSKLIFVSIFCFVISAFIALFFNFTYSKEIGYDVRGYKGDDSQDTYLYTHLFKDGEDTKFEEYEKDGFTLAKYSLYSNSPKRAIVYSGLVSEAFGLFILVLFLRTEVWDMGFHLKNRKDLTKLEQSNFYGFVIGLIAMIPSYLFLIVLTIFKSTLTNSFRVAIFKILNSFNYGFIDIICGNKILWGELKAYQILLFAISFLIVPVVTQIWFILGKKGTLISNKIIYKD